MNKRILLMVVVLLSACGGGVLGQKSDAVSNSGSVGGSTTFLPLGEVREGMRGVAKTVFRGTVPEEFNVEILGVVPGAIGPRQDLIIGRISGGSADRTSVFAGMSGSPVYVDGKLLGAISYSFPFSKEPICGITPIEQMIEIFERKESASAKSSGPKTVSYADIVSASWQPELQKNSFADSGVLSGFSQSSALMAVAGQSFRPIATPMTFNGFSQQALDAFAPQLMNVGLIPIAAVGGATPITPLKAANANTLLGGASVSMQLTRGDYSMAAAGTVTWRDGEKIYAFGHPFLSLGTSDLPMSESHVVTVVPSLNNSFKLAVPDSMVGAMTQDRATGVFGTLGVAPKMIPVRLNLETSRGLKQTLNFEVVRDDFLTPLLLNIAVYNALIAQERGLGDSTVQVRAQINVNGQVPVKLQRRFAGSQAPQLAASSIAVPVNILLRSRFNDLAFNGVEIDLTATDGSSVASIERISVDRTLIKAGETAQLQVYARTNTGRTHVESIKLTIPEGTPSGPLTIIIGDGAVLQQNSAFQQFVPANLGELIRTVNKAKFPDRLYLQAYRTSAGAIIGSNEMPNLPPSVLATFNNDRTAGGIKPAMQTIVSEIEVANTEFIINGHQTLSIEVIK